MFPLEALGVYSSCPVLTGLEVRRRLQCIVGRVTPSGQSQELRRQGRAERGEYTSQGGIIGGHKGRDGVKLGNTKP